jgi:hypothetical protein
MKVIRGKGIKVGATRKTAKTPFFEISGEFMKKIQAEVEWSRQTGEQLLGTFMLPPLQVVAASINFCTLLVITNHLFQLPFKDMNSLKPSDHLLGNLMKKREQARHAGAPAPKQQRPAQQRPSEWRANHEVPQQRPQETVPAQPESVAAHSGPESDDTE